MLAARGLKRALSRVGKLVLSGALVGWSSGFCAGALSGAFFLGIWCFTSLFNSTPTSNPSNSVFLMIAGAIILLVFCAGVGGLAGGLTGIVTGIVFFSVVGLLLYVDFEVESLCKWMLERVAKPGMLGSLIGASYGLVWTVLVVLITHEPDLLMALSHTNSGCLYGAIGGFIIGNFYGVINGFYSYQKEQFEKEQLKHEIEYSNGNELR